MGVNLNVLKCFVSAINGHRKVKFHVCYFLKKPNSLQKYTRIGDSLESCVPKLC
jgi:hypothetical protein